MLLGAAGIAVVGSGGCRAREEATQQPPLGVLREVPIHPAAVPVSVQSASDAMETRYAVRVGPDTLAAWYRRRLTEGGWRLTGDTRAPDGTITLHAVRAGPPLWIMIRPRPQGSGSLLSLVGAATDADSTP